MIQNLILMPNIKHLIFHIRFISLFIRKKLCCLTEFIIDITDMTKFMIYQNFFQLLFILFKHNIYWMIIKNKSLLILRYFFIFDPLFMSILKVWVNNYGRYASVWLVMNDVSNFARVIRYFFEKSNKYWIICYNYLIKIIKLLL